MTINANDGITEDDIAGYLANNPGFFERHAELLASVQLSSPHGTRAVSLPDNSYNRASPFLKVFGRPEATSVCECERVQSASLAQSLHLMNAADVKAKLTNTTGRAAKLAQSTAPEREKVEELYLTAYARHPEPKEAETAMAFLDKARSDSKGAPVEPARAHRLAYEDLLWALMNTKEFLFNH